MCNVEQPSTWGPPDEDMMFTWREHNLLFFHKVGPELPLSFPGGRREAPTQVEPHRHRADGRHIRDASLL